MQALNISMKKFNVVYKTINQIEKNGFYRKQHSAGTIDKIKTTIGDSRKGSNNPNAKSVTINGITYLTHKECRESLGISKRQLYKILGE